jgi:hypothetical protein
VRNKYVTNDVKNKDVKNKDVKQEGKFGGVLRTFTLGSMSSKQMLHPSASPPAAKTKEIMRTLAAFRPVRR